MPAQICDLASKWPGPPERMRNFTVVQYWDEFARQRRQQKSKRRRTNRYLQKHQTRKAVLPACSGKIASEFMESQLPEDPQRVVLAEVEGKTLQRELGGMMEAEVPMPNDQQHVMFGEVESIHNALYPYIEHVIHEELLENSALPYGTEFLDKLLACVM